MKRYSRYNLHSPLEKAEYALKKNLDYLNVALGNSEIPIRFMAWGSLQNIGKTDAEMGGTSDEVFKK